MSIEAMKLALEALEYTADYDTSVTLQKAAIAALHAAIEQAEKPDPPCKTGSQCVGGKCERCAVREEGCAECGKLASDGWALYCVNCIEPVTGDPVAWMYEDDEGRMMFSQMPHPDPLWEPLYKAKPKENAHDDF